MSDEKQAGSGPQKQQMPVDTNKVTFLSIQKTNGDWIGCAIATSENYVFGNSDNGGFYYLNDSGSYVSTAQNNFTRGQEYWYSTNTNTSSPPNKIKIEFSMLLHGVTSQMDSWFGVDNGEPSGSLSQVFTAPDSITWDAAKKIPSGYNLYTFTNPDTNNVEFGVALKPKDSGNGISDWIWYTVDADPNDTGALPVNIGQELVLDLNTSDPFGADNAEYKEV